MPTILIWMSPEPGHLLPAFKVGRDLLSRGHTVVFQVPVCLRSEVQELGFQTLPFFESFGTGVELHIGKPTRSSDAFYEGVRSVFSNQSAYLEQFRNEIRQAARTAQADLVIIDAALDQFVRLSAKRIFDPCRLVRLSVCMPFGLNSLTVRANFAAPFGVSVILAPRELEIPSRLVKEAHYTEAAVFPGFSSKGAVCDPSLDQRPLVYCSLGTQIERYPHALSIFSHLSEFASCRPDLRVVIHAGRRAPEIVSNSAASIVTEVSQNILLQHVAVMITHGGLGGIKECIWHGVPMVVIPQANDQFCNAERVVFHNLGVRLDTREVCAESLDHAVSNLMADPGIKQGLYAMRNIVRECDKESKTAQLCESLVSARRSGFSE